MRATLLGSGTILRECLAAAKILEDDYGIPADVKGFAEGELSKPSDKFVGGKSTMGLGV